MKIRTDFISNSSSTSFILALSEKPKTASELRQLLFNDDKFFIHYDSKYTTQEIADVVFDKLSTREALSSEELIEVVGSGILDGNYGSCLKYDLVCQLCNNNYDKILAMLEELNAVTIEAFTKRYAERKYYEVTFSDNDGDLHACIEHGDTFSQIPHLYINNH